MPSGSDPATLASGYRGDFAYAHQAGHSDFVRMATPTVLRFLRAAGVAGAAHELVVDLGCGTGILAGALLDEGYRVLGVDLSADMLGLARYTAPGAELVRASFVDVELPPCGAVVSVGQCLGYAFDERVGETELLRLFERAWHALRPGGLLLFDLNAPSPGRHDEAQVHVRDEADWTLVGETVVGETVLTRNLTLFRRVGDRYRRTDERHEVHLYPPEAVLDGLRAAGFTASTFHDYDGSAFGPYLVGYHAEKP
jgi:SAM-dependent methyltransferase